MLGGHFSDEIGPGVLHHLERELGSCCHVLIGGEIDIGEGWFDGIERRTFGGNPSQRHASSDDGHLHICRVARDPHGLASAGNGAHESGELGGKVGWNDGRVVGGVHCSSIKARSILAAGTEPLQISVPLLGHPRGCFDVRRADGHSWRGGFGLAGLETAADVGGA